MGVRLAKRGSRQQGHEVIRAARAVISNASVWDTQRLLPAGAAPDSWRQQAMNTPQTGSFVHLHLGVPQLSPPILRLCREHKCAQHILSGAPQVSNWEEQNVHTCGDSSITSETVPVFLNVYIW